MKTALVELNEGLPVPVEAYMLIKLEATLSLSDYYDDADLDEVDADEVIDDASSDLDAASKAALNDIYGALKGRPFDPDSIRVESVTYIEVDSTNVTHGTAYFLVHVNLPDALGEIAIKDEALGAKRLPPTKVGA